MQTRLHRWRWLRVPVSRAAVSGVSAVALTTALLVTAASGSVVSGTAGGRTGGTRAPAAATGNRAAAAVAIKAPAQATVTLITGDQVRLRTGATGQVVTPILPATRAARQESTPDFVTFTLGGDRYLVPDEAAPYLGSVLDPRLFDISYLVRAKLDDAHSATIPVNISYTAAARPALPGIQNSPAGVATGAATVVKAQAGALGRLFASQWRASRTGRSSHPIAGLSGVSRIRLAPTPDGTLPAAVPDMPPGAAEVPGTATASVGVAQPAAAAGAPAYHTLTLNVTGSDGNPAFAFGFVQNVEDARFLQIITIVPGSASYSVPTGTYSISAITFAPHAGTIFGVDTDLVNQPQVSVDSDEAITLDARTAVPYRAALTPPAGEQVPPVREDELGFVRTSQVGGGLGLDDGAAPVVGLLSLSGDGFAASTLAAAPTARVTKGVFGFDAESFFSSAPLNFGGQTQSSQPTYLLDFPHAGSVPPSLTYAVRAGDLTTVSEQTYSPPSGGSDPASGVLPDVGVYLFQRWGGGLISPAPSGGGGGVVMPGSRTDYWYSSDPRLDLWQPELLTSDKLGFSNDELGQPQAIAPGQHLDVVWDKGPAVATPAAPQMAIGGTLAGPLPVLCPACRQDDNAMLYLNPFGDSDPSHHPDPIFVGSSQVSFYRNGTLAVIGATADGLYLPMLNGTGAYRLDWTFHRAADPAASTETDWTFSSTPGNVPGPPSGELCEPDSSRSCQFLPLLFLNYDLALNFQSQAVAGSPEQIAFTVSSQQGEAAPAGVSATVSVSFDDGTTWSTPKAASTLGGDRFAVTVAQPPLASTNGFASLRVTARDGAGDSVTQTIIRAYGLTS